MREYERFLQNNPKLLQSSHKNSKNITKNPDFSGFFSKPIAIIYIL
jgi:hypothetical protein